VSIYGESTIILHKTDKPLYKIGEWFSNCIGCQKDGHTRMRQSVWMKLKEKYKYIGKYTPLKI